MYHNEVMKFICLVFVSKILLRDYSECKEINRIYTRNPLQKGVVM